MLNTRWTAPDPVPELAGTPVRMAALVKDDAGLAVASPENAAVIGLDWTMCSASSWMTHSTSCGDPKLSSNRLAT